MKHKSIKAMLLCLAAVAVLAMAMVPAQAKKRNVNPRVIPPQAMPYGMSYGDWGGRWQQWVSTTPVPYTEGTGSNSGEGQSGPVWFLGVNQSVIWLEEGPEAYVAVGTADWTITMPAGKAVFVPIRQFCITAPPGSMTETELQASIELDVNHVTELGATVDGRPLGNLFAYRGTSSLFSLYWVAGDLWGFGPGDLEDAVTDGYWVMLAPLPVGHHVVNTHSVDVYTAEEDGVDFTFTSDNTYHITVTPR
jgi:hypothetical protein